MVNLIVMTSLLVETGNGQKTSLLPVVSQPSKDQAGIGTEGAAFLAAGTE